MTVQALTLQKTTLETLPAFHALIEASFRGSGSQKGWCSEAEYFTSARISSEEMLAKFSHPDSTLFEGYDATGALVTCCELLKKDAATCYFGMFAVDPTKQGGGIGNYVLNAAEEFAREELGCKRMEMQVIASRDTLIAYYSRRGYVRSKESRPFPYELFDKGSILRDDLCFAVLEKDIA